jgi:VWFA-related protein
MKQVLRPLPATVRFCWIFLLSAHLYAQQTNETPPESGSSKIIVTVNAVLVPVVVRDSQGRAVGNLEKKDFEVFDRNKPQAISGFTIQKRVAVESYRKDAEPTPIGPGATQPPETVPERFIVFLFDDLHLDTGDLTEVQKVATKMVAGSLTDSDLAAVVSMSGVSSGLTHDRAKLQAAIMNLKVHNLYRHIGRACPDIDYYEADRIQNKGDIIAVDKAIDNTMSCCDHCRRDYAQVLVENAAREALDIGDQDIRVTLGVLSDVVRKMGSMPGQRTLVLISPGFLTATPEAMNEKSHILDLAARANVTISALDARGLYTTVIGASDGSLGGAQVQRNKAQDRADSMVLNEDVLEDLADGTGGTYFHNSNDLQGGFQALTAVPEYIYLLELSLQGVKQDGSYHTLKVKVDQDGLKLKARLGYFAPKQSKSKLEPAVSTPKDVKHK